MGDEIERFVISSAQRGDTRAWRQLFSWHFDAVYRFSLALSTGRNDWAEEITQEVFVTAAAQIVRFDFSQGTFRMWLLGIARKHHLSLRAKETRRKRHEAASMTGNSEVSINSALELSVHETLAQMPHHYRDILEAKYLRQMKTTEIAEAQNKTVVATESLLRRARDRFAEVYEQLKQ